MLTTMPSRWSRIQIFYLSLLLITFVNFSQQLPPKIRVGIILERGDEHLNQTLQNAIEKFNKNKIILPRTQLEYDVHFVSSSDSFDASRIICTMLEQNIWALISMSDEPTHSFVRSLSNDLQIPHLTLSWDYRSSYLDNINQHPRSTVNGGFISTEFNSHSFTSLLNRPIFNMNNRNQRYSQTSYGVTDPKMTSKQQFRNKKNQNVFSNPKSGNPNNYVRQSVYEDHFSISLFPNSNHISWAFSDLVRSRNWKSMTIIYDNTDGLILLRDLIQIASSKQSRHVKVNVMEFPKEDRVAVVSRDGLINDLHKNNFNNDDHNNNNNNNNNNDNFLDNKYNHNYNISVKNHFDYEQQLRNKKRLEKSFKNSYEEMVNLAGNAKPQIDIRRDYLYQKLLKDLKKTEHNFVLALEPEKTLAFLEHAYKAKRMSEYDNFLIASWDFHRLDLSDFRHKTLANITGYSMLSGQSITDDLDVAAAVSSMNLEPLHRARQTGKPFRSFSASSYQTEKIHSFTTKEALIYDAIMLLAHSLDDLDRSTPETIQMPHLSCQEPEKRWMFGAHFVSYMKQLRYLHGLTGLLNFDSNGQRVNFTLDLLQVKPDGLRNVATWTLDKGLTSTANYTFYDSYKQILEAMKYKEFKVTVPPEVKPYIYLKDNHTDLSGNDKFDGFCVDLLKKIQQVFQQEFNSDFKYQIRFVADGKYGRPNKETGEWDGMLGELMRHQSDLAIADLTATYLRETAVDFTMPFMNLGIAILFKKTAQPDPELFSFLKPLSVPVWLYLASAFLGISMFFWILSRLSPYEWVSPHSCDPEPLELENQFSIGNSLWFSIGSLMQQGSDIAPRALSTRALASVWWFFTLIMISSYTANLAASLTLSRMAPAISNVEDLAKQTTIQYGCKKGGSTYEFFQNSNHTTYQRMFNTMESNPEVYINMVDDAIERVRKGGYAYLAESSTIEYLIQRKCDLYQVGIWLDNKGYGIATPTDSPYRTPISNAIVVLQDRGELYELKKKWWIDLGGGLCVDDPKLASASELKIENLGGVFVVLGGGVGLGALFGALEFIWKSLKIARDERESIYKLIWLEIVRICTGGGSSRPVYQAQSSANLNNPGNYGLDSRQDTIPKSSSITNLTSIPPPPPPLPSQQTLSGPMSHSPTNVGVTVPLGTPLGNAVFPIPSQLSPPYFPTPGGNSPYGTIYPNSSAAPYPFDSPLHLSPPRTTRSQINSPARPAKSPSASAYNGMY